MKQTVNFSDFTDAFRKVRPENFTYEGLKALFDDLEELDRESEQEMELDVIGLCCDFTEYANLEEFQADYNAEEYPDMDSIQDSTHVIPVGSEGFIIQAF